MDSAKRIQEVEQFIRAANWGDYEIPNILGALGSLYRLAVAQQEEIVKLQEQIAALQAAVPSGAAKE